MPTSSVYTFTEPDAYAAAVRATTAHFTVVERGHFAAKLIRIDLHDLEAAARQTPPAEVLPV